MQVSFGSGALYQEHTGNSQERPVMKRTTMIIVVLITVLFIFPLVAAILTPPDVIAQVYMMSIMTLVGGILAFIISRFKSYKQTPQSIKILIIVFVLLLSITIAYSVMSFVATID